MMTQGKILTSEQASPLGSFIPPLPAQYGYWTGTRGNSSWMFDLNSQRADIFRGGRTAWRNLLRRCVYPNADHVDFGVNNPNYPDFSPYLVDVTSQNPSRRVSARYVFPAGSGGLTTNRPHNFRMADGWLARRLAALVADVAYYRSDKEVSWHEVEDCQTMLLVPWAIHGNVPHGGGIEVLKQGSIGREREDADMEELWIGDRRFLCGGGLCRGTLSLPAQGKTQSVEVVFYCEDEGGKPTPVQEERLDSLQERWSQVGPKAWSLLQEYADSEWAAIYGPGCGDTAALEMIQIFPEHPDHKVPDIGLLYGGFAPDPEHGLGVRILGNQDDRMIAGVGDIAL